MLAGVTATKERHDRDPMVGRVIDGRFEIEALLGTGAVGSVYRAQERAENRVVALKIWNTPAHNDQTRGRFMREAKALQTLRHPNIVDVYRYGVSDVLPYVAMEFLDGRTVDALLSKGEPLDAALAFDVMTQVLKALAYAHDHGVVHRDLKPDNVVLVQGPRGQPLVKLLDYGLAKFMSPDDDPVRGRALTVTGMVMGTPLYMAPEQAAGKRIDARVDVYAAGCLLFEMLTGQPPYAGETNAELIRLHMTAEIPRLHGARLDSLATGAVQGVIDRALAKQPEARFAHAGEMLEAVLAVPRPALRLALSIPPANLDNQGPSPRSDRLPLLAALITGLCTAAALAYALLR